MTIQGNRIRQELEHRCVPQKASVYPAGAERAAGRGRFLYVSLGDDPSADGLQNAMHQERAAREKGAEKFTWLPKQLVES